VHAVTWVGADEPDREYIDRLSSLGVNVAGVSTDIARTPSCYLFYGPLGETVVAYDPGDRTDGTLGAAAKDCRWLRLRAHYANAPGPTPCWPRRTGWRACGSGVATSTNWCRAPRSTQWIPSTPAGRAVTVAAFGMGAPIAGVV
jgi:hypothetical protein